MNVRIFRRATRATPAPQTKRKARSTACLAEPMERRQLLSTVIDVRVVGASGTGKSAIVGAVGQVVQLQVRAIVTGKDASGSNDGFQGIAGSFLSTMTATGSVRGKLSAGNTAPFNARSAQAGKLQDLNGDGNQDVGTNSTGTLSFGDAFNARANSLIYNAAHTFLIGSLSFTVTSLSSSQATQINFRPRLVPGQTSAAWSEDKLGRNEFTSSLSVGGPVTITGTNLQTGSIAGHVFSDLNGNQIKDIGESGVEGATVYADVNNNKSLDNNEPRFKTESAGDYLLANLPAGTYLLRQTLPVGFKQITPTPGTGRSVTLATGQQFINANFTALPAASIAGNLFNDLNGDGQRQGGEPNLSGRKFFLDLNKNAKADAGEATVSTDSSGNFKFTNLFPNIVYRVREALPAGWRVSQPGGDFYDVAPAPGQNVTGRNFADTQKVLISGNVFNDINSNAAKNTGEAGRSGWRVYIDLNDDGQWQSNENNKLTDAAGNFSFVSLNAGAFHVRAVVPVGYTQTAPGGNGAFNPTLASGQRYLGKLFGIHRI